MINGITLQTKSATPTSMGTGLIVLDMVLNGKNKNYPDLLVGGSCGNVLTILAYLDWSSYPVARIGNDFGSKTILNDMKRWGVKTDFVHNNEKSHTPIIVERIKKNGTKNRHVFEFKCPYCGSILPKNRPVPKNMIAEIMTKMPDAQVFYIDRVSRTALELAKEQKSRGALIVFEPHRINKRKIFSEFLGISDIVKYSAEQIDDIPADQEILLEIKTLGDKGLSYCWKGTDNWKKISAVKIPKFVDSAGAGDWCTAGIIHILGQNGFKGFSEASEKDLEIALRFGQHLAALNCLFEGARGLMYRINRNKLSSITCDSSSFLKIQKYVEEYPEKTFLNHICPSCKNSH